MTTQPSIGETVRLLRSQRDWTQAQLAEKAGIHLRTVSQIERGEVEPRLATRIRIARALGADLPSVPDHDIARALGVEGITVNGAPQGDAA